MPVGLLNPNNLNPNETHEYEFETWLQFTDQEEVTHTGKVFNRGYTYDSNTPVYAVNCEDNYERAVTEPDATALPPLSESQ